MMFPIWSNIDSINCGYINQFEFRFKFSSDNQIPPERPGCRCVDSFFLDLSPPRLPRRHRLPHAGFIPDIYNLADVCDIALDLLNSDRRAMQRSRSYPVARELIMGTESMVRITLLFNFKTG